MLRPLLHRLLLGAMAGAIACDDAATPAAATGPRSAPLAGEPRFTVGAGMPATSTNRGHVGTFRLNTIHDRFNVQMHAQDDADMVLVTVTASPGGHSGWHYHPGPAFVVVKTGAVTSYRADDPTCTGTVYPAGTVLIEADVPHILRNEGSVPSEFGVMFLVPAGTPQRLDSPAPGNCPF